MLDLYPHQEDAIKRMHNGCILWGGVGTGKSRAAVGYYLINEAPKNVLVITTAKKRDSGDWEEEFQAINVGVIPGKPDHGVLTVDSWNNIEKYLDFEGFVIFDEQRVVGSGKWVQAFIQIASRCRWILLSATPGDTWLDYIPVFIANGFYRNRTEFTDSHVVYKRFRNYPVVDRFLGEGKLIRLRKQILVEMPYRRHTTREVHYVDVEFDCELYERSVEKRWDPYLMKPMKDVAQLFRVMRKIVNSDRSRIDAVLTILDKHPRLIVFYNFDYELEILREITGLKDGIAIAEWNGHNHEPIPDTERWVYLVQYAAGSEGWNCTSTDAMVFYSLTYSYKQFHQAQGRIDRLNAASNLLHYYILLSEASIDHGILRSLGRKEDFNERKFMLNQ